MHNIISNSESKPLSEATKDELLSARAHAWVQFFASKDDKPFGTSWDDYQTELDQIREGFGIDAIEDELRSRGINPKSKDYTRVSASFDLA